MRSARRLVGALAAALAVGLGLAACTGDEPARTPAETPRAEGPPTRLEVGPPVWRSAATGIRGSRAPQVGDDVILLVGHGPRPDGRGRDDVVAAFDRGTGEQLWQRFREQPVAGLRDAQLSPLGARLGREPGAPVIVPFHRGHRRLVEGVVALTPRTGEMRWWRAGVRSADASPGASTEAPEAGDRVNCGCTVAVTRDELVVLSAGGTFSTLLAGESEPRPMPRLPSGVAPLAGAGDLVWGTDGAATVALDRTGRPVSDPVPGRLVTLGDDHLVLEQDRGRTRTFEVVPYGG